ncbi:MAG: hypothetical protein K8R69_06910 [Deltaproteobacteria bacterium]|nr:hypothetical protein [Deltaproteobacteria bacterium]
MAALFVVTACAGAMDFGGQGSSAIGVSLTPIGAAQGSNFLPSSAADDPVDNNTDSLPISATTTTPVTYGASSPMVAGAISTPISLIPGHPEGEVSPGVDVRIVAKYSAILKREVLCKTDRDEVLFRVNGRLLKEGKPASTVGFLRIVDVDRRLYLDTPVFTKDEAPGYIDSRFAGQPIKNIEIYITEEEQPEPSWDTPKPWPSQDSPPTENYMNITHAFGTEVLDVAEAGSLSQPPVPICGIIQKSAAVLISTPQLYRLMAMRPEKPS